MVQEHLIRFGPFRLEATRARLWHDEQVIPMRSRSFAVLWYLATHPGRLVSKAELRHHIWSNTHVTDTVLRVCIREIRAALGDVAETPQYVETVIGQGYKFRVPDDPAGSPPPVTDPIIVGRQHEVEILDGWFQRATQGERQMVFLSGEAGIGKTTLVDLWLARLAAGRTVWIGRGLCSEHYGAGEPYMPLLDALRRLTDRPAASELLSVLRGRAPMWLAQLPGLVSDAELERMQRQVQGTTQARMMRELGEALDLLTAGTPLVLVLEDLHWSDNATVECLAFLAQRRDPARLMVLGTYRPVETVIHAHPLRGMVQELIGRGQGVELRLELLAAAEVSAYVAARLGGPVSAELAGFINERTEGNALFMVDMVEHLVRHGLIMQQEGRWMLAGESEAKLVGIPEGLRQLLMRRVEELQPGARRVLEAASVAGEAFTAAAVAAGAQCPVEEVEAVCDGLAAQQHFLDDVGLTVCPDGTSRGSYRFRHALYAQVLYEQLGSARRMQLHRRIGLCLETGYGAQADEIAAQLAIHFERGGEVRRAVCYLQQVADNAARRNVHHETVVALSKGLALLSALPDRPERAQHELALLLILGQQLMAVKGYGAPEVGEVYSRAHTLCQRVGEPRQHCQVLQGLYRFHLAQVELRRAGELSQQFLRLAPHQHDMTLVLEGQMDLGLMAFYNGAPATACDHLKQSLRLYDSQRPPRPVFSGGHEARVTTLLFLAMVLGLLGHADQARQCSQEALARARQVEHTPSVMWAQLFTALLSQQRRDVSATQTYAETMVALAAAQGFERHVEHGRILRGWTLAMQGDAATGLAYIQQGLEAVQRTGLRLYRPYFLALLAEAYGQAGQFEAGLAALDDALTLVTTTDEQWWEAELHRLKGELLMRLTLPDFPRSTACFQQALEVARRQQAKSLELRAALSLSRLWQHDKREQARRLLTEVYNWFTEGFETPDLQAARVWLRTSAG